jgi:hypothetical protein
MEPSIRNGIWRLAQALLWLGLACFFAHCGRDYVIWRDNSVRTSWLVISAIVLATIAIGSMIRRAYWLSLACIVIFLYANVLPTVHLEPVGITWGLNQPLSYPQQGSR